ncbi:AsmA family protein [Undibacterium sp. Jales W-56]|uniref:AsmA family protein n=1 Tax=Undibacterium sp. Jales W-56 TaxID=2897325 RepID=UPI0021D08E56|nr:AsmA family protein [Undibacterium sp. Jales W-56]MCU6433865.1 AsmA family protein [Undibacterium sp. Jales W-56]
MYRIKLIVFTCLLAIPVIALIVFTHLDWNRAKPWLNARTSETLGRPFAIRGDLSLTWDKQAVGPELEKNWRGMIPWPHLIAKDIHISNPASLAVSTVGGSSDASPAAEMASIEQFAFSLNPLALLDKKIAIPVLRFDAPSVNLLRNADGQNNWTLPGNDQASVWKIELQRVIFTKGSVHLLDAVKHADVHADIDTIDTDPGYGVSWKLHGKYDGETVSGSGKAGAILSLQQQTAPYPIMANLHLGKTMIAIEGTLTKPTELAALDMRLKIAGTSMARLYALSGIVMPETPPFTTEGHLIGTLGRHSSHWIYDNFSGKVGSSDIGGTLDLQTRPSRPVLTGTILSHLLQFSDLAPLIGADSNSSKAERGATAHQPADKVLPVEKFKTERWTSVDAKIQFRAEKIIREKELPINKLTTTLQLQDGVLRLSPLSFDVASGKLNADITLDGSGKADQHAIKARMKISARHLKLKQLFPTLDALQASIGEINGDASLSATGNSVASLLGASNGEIKTQINQGSISKRLLEEMGLNIGNVVLTYLSGDKQVKLNCMATDFSVTNGVMQTRTFIVDTDDAILNVNGNINMTQEQLDLTIKPNSKGLRIFSLRTPLYVRGSFKDPKVSIDKGVLALKAGGALALAAAAPVAALLPLINAGPDAESGCTQLLADARVKPVAPAPGKTYRAKAAVK